VDCSAFNVVQLQYAHDFNWVSGGGNESAEVYVRANGGTWNNVKTYSADAGGVELIDITGLAAGQASVEVRFTIKNANNDGWWAVDDCFLLGSNSFGCGSSFTSYGTGCAGTGGLVPQLDFYGIATPSGEVSAQVTSGLPNGFGILLVGLSPAAGGPCQYKVANFLSVFPLTLDPAGEFSLTGTVGPNAAAGVHGYFQWVGLDAGAPNNLSFSNGVDMLTE